MLPRMVRRRPLVGDIHPILTRQLKMVLNRLPLEYMYNLSSVEMLPRTSDIGDPFGMYMSDEKRIVLYSLPLNWELDYGTVADAEAAASSLELKTFDAEVEVVGNNISVTWPDARRMGYWLCCVVLLHEFSHHFRATYRAKRKSGIQIRRGDEEFFADSRSFDAFREVFVKHTARNKSNVN